MIREVCRDFGAEWLELLREASLTMTTRARSLEIYSQSLRFAWVLTERRPADFEAQERSRGFWKVGARGARLFRANAEIAKACSAVGALEECW